jgi:hypothetical protein
MEQFMGRTIEECISEMLFHPSQAKRFLRLSDDVRLGLLLEFLIGPESERYNAAPTYGKTGIGYLKSKGADGLKNEIELEKRLCSGPERAKAIRFLALVKRAARKMTEEYEPA